MPIDENLITNARIRLPVTMPRTTWIRLCRLVESRPGLYDTQTRVPAKPYFLKQVMRVDLACAGECTMWLTGKVTGLFTSRRKSNPKMVEAIIFMETRGATATLVDPDEDCDVHDISCDWQLETLQPLEEALRDYNILPVPGKPPLRRGKVMGKKRPNEYEAMEAPVADEQECSGQPAPSVLPGFFDLSTVQGRARVKRLKTPGPSLLVQVYVNDLVDLLTAHDKMVGELNDLQVSTNPAEGMINATLINDLKPDTVEGATGEHIAMPYNLYRQMSQDWLHGLTVADVGTPLQRDHFVRKYAKARIIPEICSVNTQDLLRLVDQAKHDVDMNWIKQVRAMLAGEQAMGDCSASIIARQLKRCDVTDRENISDSGMAFLAALELSSMLLNLSASYDRLTLSEDYKLHAKLAKRVRKFLDGKASLAKLHNVVERWEDAHNDSEEIR